MIVIPYSINRKKEWDNFVQTSKNGTFLLERDFMDYHNDRFHDCSVMVYDVVNGGEVTAHDSNEIGNLLAVMPANWVADEQTVYSHKGLTYGGLMMSETTTTVDVLKIMVAIINYYHSYLQAKRLVYLPIPYIYSTMPSQEDLYGVFRLKGKLTRRLISTVIDREHTLGLRTLRMRGAKKAVENGLYIDRMTDGDRQTLSEYWNILTEVLETQHGVRPVHSMEEMELLMSRFPHNIRLNIVRNAENCIVAGIVVFITKRVVHVQYIAANNEGKQKGALDLLFKKVITEMYPQQQYIDFGNSNEDGGWSVNEGLIFQKEGFGGRAVCYDMYEININNALNIVNNAKSNSINQILYLNLKRLNDQHEPQLSESINAVTTSGFYLLGEWNRKFSQAWAKYCKRMYCVNVANGLDALTLAMLAMKIQRNQTDGEVIVPANTFIATILAILRAGLTPKLVEPDADSMLLNIEKAESAINGNTIGILPVHLYGRTCDMNALRSIADKNNLWLIDDCAQSHGAELDAKSDISCWSFYPGKNLGALGDAGAITTDNEELATIVSQLSNYGQCEKYLNKYVGVNSRMDEIQAAALYIKLQSLDQENSNRRNIAMMYQGITNPLVKLPKYPKNPLQNVWHIFPLRCTLRNQLQQYLQNNGVQTLIHYPVAPHKQDALKNFHWAQDVLPITEKISREEISLPIDPYMDIQEVERIIKLVNEFNI